MRDLHPLSGPFAWSGSELEASGRWRRAFSSIHVDELAAATRSVRERGIPLGAIRREDFPLRATADLLSDISEELEGGCGLVNLTGLPLERFDEQDLRSMWMGIGVHLGTPRQQDHHGQLMRAICDEGPEAGTRYGQMQDPADRGVFLSSRARTASTAALRYHTDRTDIVALLCVRPAVTGGVNRIASAVAVHNSMLARRPDLAAELYRDYFRSRLGEEADGAERFYALPVFAVRDGKFTSHYSRTYIEAAQRLSAVPKMSESQWQALDVLASLCDELCLEMRLSPGDMQFINNHVVYHSRTPFEDAVDPARKRLLYRLWLSAPNSRALPAGHEVLWGNIEAGALRGGIT